MNKPPSGGFFIPRIGQQGRAVSGAAFCIANTAGDERRGRRIKNTPGNERRGQEVLE